jgi:sugar lactone lactonase YvrE
MTARPLRTLLEHGAFFEGPRWRTGRWWVSDFYRRVVLTVDEDGGEEEVMSVAGQPSGLGWLPDGSLLVVSMKERRVLRRSPDGEVAVHAELAEHCGGPANDMVVDGRGRAYVANFGFELTGAADVVATSLVRVDPDGAVSAAADGLVFPNGPVITPDGRTLVIGETFASRHTAFTIADDGSLTDRRVWAQVDPAPASGTVSEVSRRLRYAPDGATLDAEGHLWSADAGGGRCCRLAAGGEIVDEVRAPDGLGVFACALGGEDGRTLLICAAPDSRERARSAAREAVLFTTRVEVPHAGLP